MLCVPSVTTEVDSLATLLDTSALAKLYHREAGTEFVSRLLENHEGSAFLSRLGLLEMHSVLASKVRTGEMIAEESALLRRRFRSDVRSRRFRIVALRLRHYSQAEELLEKHGPSRGLRALDALQLAVALDLHRNGVIDSMITADKVLLRVAPIENIVVFNPESEVVDR